VIGGETLVPVQQLFRMAWLKARRIPLFDQKPDIIDWEQAIKSIIGADDDDRGMSIPVDKHTHQRRVQVCCKIMQPSYRSVNV
jgi:hypothetical protein